MFYGSDEVVSQKDPDVTIRHPSRELLVVNLNNCKSLPHTDIVVLPPADGPFDETDWADDAIHEDDIPAPAKQRQNKPRNFGDNFVLYWYETLNRVIVIV